MPSTFLPRLRNCGLAAPTGDDIRFLLRSIDPEHFEEVWAIACAQAGVSVAALHIELDDLDLLAEALKLVQGAVSLAGRTLAIRTATYRAFAAKEATGRVQDWGRSTQESLVFHRIPTAARMAEVARLDLFSTEAGYKLSAAARRAADALGTQIGLVNVLLEGAQAFAGSHNISGWADEAGGTPIEWAMCSKLVRTREAYVVPDAEHDVIERQNPIVELSGLRSYAGVPLITSNGHVVGSVCALGVEPKAFDEHDVNQLRRIADDVLSSVDPDRRFA